MRIAIATTQTPFLRGGAEILAEDFRDQLVQRGHEAEIVTLPFKWYPAERIVDAMMMARLTDLSEAAWQKIDRVIALKFPAYFVRHPAVIGWILHQHRQAYELFGTEHGDLHQSPEGMQVTSQIRHWDNELLPRLQALYGISQTVVDRLQRFNGLSAGVLYPPPRNAEKFAGRRAGNFIIYPGRLDRMKRQHLLVEALAQSAQDYEVFFFGPDRGDYAEETKRKAEALGVAKRVRWLGVIDEDKKRALYAECFAVYNGVVEEDYGYVTAEAFLSSKPVVTHHDSGGPLEFVRDGETGVVCAPTPQETARAFDALYSDRAKAERMGGAAREFALARDLSWDKVVERLLA